LGFYLRRRRCSEIEGATRIPPTPPETHSTYAAVDWDFTSAAVDSLKKIATHEGIKTGGEIAAL